MIDLYTAPTPNGYKVSVTLEELGLPYETHVIDLMSGQQKTPEFLAINPNGRIPAIIDRGADGFSIFESGAIMIYLAEKAGRLLPDDRKQRSIVLQWLMFQMGGLGPMMGQANVFVRYFPERIESVIDRYRGEVLRLFAVLDERLRGREYLAEEYSIADIANWCWVRSYEWPDVSIDGFPNLNAWHDRIAARPAASAGVQVPFDTVALLKTKEGQDMFLNAARTLVDSQK